MEQEYPILEYDDSVPAIIEPREILKPLEGISETCVMCFFQQVIEDVCGDGKAEIVGHIKSEAGHYPIYVVEVPGLEEGETRRVTVVHPGVGAPFAAAVLDEMIAYGAKKFIACGGAGVLDGDVAVGHVVIPEYALRDEGTSYHYLPASRMVAPSPIALKAIKKTLEAHKVPHIVGKTWTTDAIYRETRAMVEKRRAEGCITVEMEASAFFAVARFRGVTFGQLLYGGDDLSGDVWDSRDWHSRTSTREKIFWLAVESALRL